MRPIASPADLERWRALAVELADEADRMSMAGFRRDIRIETKPDGTYVTEVDRAIEAMIRPRLRAADPGCGVVGEEEGREAEGSALRWYVDPIDGTHNYMRGIPVFATLLAVALDGEVQLGVVSAPGLHERWLGWRGGGAWRGNSRLAVSRVASLPQSQLLYGSRSDDMRSGLVPGLDATLASAWRERGYGDFWGHMLVAEGAAEGMIDTGAYAWDWAAPSLIVEEAGGLFTTAGGERRYDGGSAISSNGLVHTDLLRSLTTSQA